MQCGLAGCSSSESSQAKPGEAVDDDPEVAYVKFLLGGSEAHQRAYEEDNEQARKMFQELKSSSGHTSEVWPEQVPALSLPNASLVFLVIEDMASMKLSMAAQS